MASEAESHTPERARKLAPAAASEQAAPLLVVAHVVATVAGVAESTWWKLDSAGRTPAPIRLGRATRWNIDEVRDWIAAGAPPRDRWNAMRRQR